MDYEQRKLELKDIFEQIKPQFENKGYTLEKVAVSYIEGEYTYNLVISND